ncbi:MAG: NADP-dependent phosphogluconate dehydrogenase [Myxococcota bacterium]
MTQSTQAPRCDVALVGLGVMGANLARNFARRGRRVAIHDRLEATTHALAARHPEAGFVACDSVAALVAALARPRTIVLLVPAGAPVDDALASLAAQLEPDDVVIDAGNSDYRETDRRLAESAAKAWRFVGMGISGGSEGALVGPSMMPGGDPRVWPRLQPLLEPIAAVADGEPCVAWCGRTSAGHFVKMVHNGIEYGDMQLIAETAFLMRRGLGWNASRCAEVFDAWNAAELESFLVEITAGILRVEDPERPGQRLLDAVLDRAGQKGTGRWTVEAALALGVAIPTITAAVDARSQSAALDERIAASAIFATDAGAVPRGAGPTSTAVAGAVPIEAGPLAALGEDDLRDALYAAKIASYSQGFALLARASAEQAYGSDLARIARLWKAGCIIRARFLDDVSRAFGDAAKREPGSAPLLALTPRFATELRARLPGWRRVVAAATAAGLPIPGLSASLAWFDTLTTRRGSADLIQAQRDWFGSHGYERTDAPGSPAHTDWAAARRLD